MGMFDWVTYAATCPKCNEVVTKFQSKDGPCRLKRLRPGVHAQYFYATCKCGHSVSGEWIPPKEAYIKIKWAPEWRTPEHEDSATISYDPPESEPIDA